VNAAQIAALRAKTGAGMTEAKNALACCDGDALLAEGYLKFSGLAVNIRAPGKTDAQAYADWVWANAKRYAAERRP
jgi:translation elongation factor EF-Ts